MSQAEARSWWADVEHLREAAERRQAEETRRPASPTTAEEARDARARARAAARVQEAGAGSVDDLSARRAIAAEERAPRPRRPVPIWLADESFGDPVAASRARASAPRRTVEIRGQLVATMQQRPPLGVPDDRALVRRRERSTGVGALLVGRPDRLAFWAFALGLALALAAVTTH